MYTAGHPAEQALRGIGCLGDKGVHIVSAGEVQVAPQFAVKRVFHRHIDHHASLIHHRVKLGAHLIGGPVHTGQDAGVAAGGRMNMLMEVALLVGSIFAAIKMAGYTGFSIAVAIYFLNESLGRPVQKMAAPVVAVMIPGILLNVLYWLGLFVPA